MDWDIAGLTGNEIYNTHADFKDEMKFMAALRSPLTLLTLGPAVKEYPQEVFGALLDYPADYLKRYDQLCQQARHTGVSANDSHHNQAFRGTAHRGGQGAARGRAGQKTGDARSRKNPAAQAAGRAASKPGEVVFELDLDPYARSFRHVSTHLLLHEVTPRASGRRWKRAGPTWHSIGWPIRRVSFIGPTPASKTGRSAARSRWPTGLRLRAEAPLDGQDEAAAQRRSRSPRTRRACLDFAVDRARRVSSRSLADAGRRSRGPGFSRIRFTCSVTRLHRAARLVCNRSASAAPGRLPATRPVVSRTRTSDAGLDRSRRRK